MDFEKFILENAELLLEANVYNVKVPYENVSILDYLKKHTQYIGTQQGKNVFVKKLSKLLLNAPKWHHDVRQLPPDAPEWARQGLENKDLVYFKPDQELEDVVSNIAHYVAAIEQDSKQTKNEDAKVVATRELQKFPKVENLEVLQQKANEYFKRGSKKAGREISGMTEVIDAGDGFTWYELIEEQAFKREGKVLQNCIGSYYTAAKSRSENTRIFILKTPVNETVVGLRIKDHEFQEAKGKNNKPPIAKYMPYVGKFINGFNVKVGTNQYDLTNAGYVYIDHNLLSVPEAIKRYVDSKKLFDLNKGMSVHKIIVPDRNLSKLIYGESEAIGTPTSTVYVFEIRDSQDNPHQGIVVKNKEVTDIKRHNPDAVKRAVNESLITLVEAPDNTKPIIADAIEELVDRGYVVDVGKKVAGEITWQDGHIFDANKGNFKPRKPQGKHTTDAKFHDEWEKYDETTAPGLFKSLNPVGWIPQGNDHEGVKNIYLRTVRKAKHEHKEDTRDIMLAGVEREGGLLDIMLIDGNGMTNKTGAGHKVGVGIHGGSIVDYAKRDPKLVDAIKHLANSLELKLPNQTLYKIGLTGEPGKYTDVEDIVKPQEVPGRVPAIKYDFTKITPEERRMGAFFSVITHPDHLGVRPKKDRPWNTSDTPVDRFDYGEHSGPKKMPDIHKKDKFTGDVHDKILKNTNKHAPDALYVLDVEYGHDKKHPVYLITNGNKIVRVDDHTANHEWQHWEDNSNVASQIRSFAQEHGFTFKRGAIKGGQKSDLMIHRQDIMSSEEALTTKQHEIRGKHRTPEEKVEQIPFHNGYTLKKVDPNKFAKWARKGPKKNISGEGWVLEDEHGNPITVGIVHNKKVKDFYAVDKKDPPLHPDLLSDTAPEWMVNLHQRKHDEWSKKDRAMQETGLPVESGLDSAALPYFLSAAKKLGWDLSGTNNKHISLTGKTRDALDRLERRSSSGGQHRKTKGHMTQYEKKLHNMGLVNIIQKSGDNVAVVANDKGRRALRSENWIETAHGAAEIDKSFTLPMEQPKQEEKKEKTPKKKTKATGSNKASQALSKFEEMINDNDGTMPSRKEFMTVLQDDPFNMSKAGAQTYYYNTKTKYMKANDMLPESYSFKWFVEFLG